MKFDRTKFWSEYKAHFGKHVTQEQVDGLEFLLTNFEANPFWKNIRHIAYALATIKHECADSYQPVEEGYYLGSPAKVKRFQKSLRYSPYFGRGYVQLTWLKNYTKAGKALGVDLLIYPDLALERQTAFDVMTWGMFGGHFTGKKLSDYINEIQTDYVAARRIINGTDQAKKIAGYAESFEEILNSSKLGAVSSHTVDNPKSEQGEESLLENTANTNPVLPSDNPRQLNTSGEQSSSATVGINTEGAEPRTAETNAVVSPEQTSTEQAVENSKPPVDNKAEITKESPSLFTKIGVGITAITGFGINLGSVIQTKIENMTPGQMFVIACGVALVALAIWAWDRSSQRANRLTQQKMEIASDKNSITTEVK